MTPSDRSAGRAVRHRKIGLSVEAEASSWIGEGGALDGSVVALDTEIAGRGRLGEPWQADVGDALAVGVVVRPEVSIGDQGLLWLAALVAAADAVDTSTGPTSGLAWPDGVVAADGSGPVASVNVVTRLGPGRIDHAVLAVRFRLSPLDLGPTDRPVLVDRAADAVDGAVGLLDGDRTELLERTTDRLVHLGRRVRATLLPRGESRGEVTAIDPDGCLVLRSPTGMLERIPVDRVRGVEVA